MLALLSERLIIALDHLHVVIPLMILAIWVALNAMAFWLFIILDVSYRQILRFQFITVISLAPIFALGPSIGAIIDYSKENGLSINLAGADAKLIAFIFLCALVAMAFIAERYKQTEIG